VRDQIIREPRDDKNHWVEQTVVLFPSGQQAANFFRNSRDQFKSCANSSVTTQGSDDSSYDWKFGQVAEPSDTMFSVQMQQQNSDNWVCQHAMGAVSNLIVEAVACGRGVGTQSQEIVQGIVQNATSQ
jgi:PknH-like extracellular domain